MVGFMHTLKIIVGFKHRAQNLMCTLVLGRNGSEMWDVRMYIHIYLSEGGKRNGTTGTYCNAIRLV